MYNFIDIVLHFPELDVKWIYIMTIDIAKYI